MHRRHRKKPTLITSNLGFTEWGPFLKNAHLTAVLIAHREQPRPEHEAVRQLETQTQLRIVSSSRLRNLTDQLRTIPLEEVLRLTLPPPEPAKLWRVRSCLLRERHLPLALIESLIQSGTLYADHRANAVFLLLGKENQPVGAELRGTTVRPWHALAPGSQKDLGFFSLPAEPLPAIILVESAIDAISCFALHPRCRCISTAGARPNPRWLVPWLGQGSPIYCGFDADLTGENMARALIALHPAVQRLRPPQHNWNDVLRARS